MTSTTTNTSEDWNSLVFGVYSLREIREYTCDTRWQRVRVNMLGRSLTYKWCELNIYLQQEAYSYEAKCRVTNYVNALKRGGLIK
jgi:hypothetical protein